MSQAYYGRSIIKPPEWTDLIPLYFFSGGLAGACATLAFAARLRKNDRLARTMLCGSAAATALSTYCLIADLKRPERFLNMLRVFKPTSPMSVGVYIFSAFAGSIFLAAGAELTAIARPWGRITEGIAALLGPIMSVYTGVLIGDTVIPAWHRGRRTMPLLFAATSASSAGAFGMFFGPKDGGAAARRLAIGGALGIPLALERLRAEVGSAQWEAYELGQAGMLARSARFLNIAGAICALVARRRNAMARVAGALLLGGGLAERFAIYRAGVASARDPKYVIESQRARAGSFS